MKKGLKRIGEILIAKGWITEAQLHDALQEQKLSDKFLGAIMIDKGWISDHNLIEALSEQFGIPIARLESQYINMDLAGRFSSSLIVDHKCFPISETEETITVAILNPLNAVAMSKVEEEARPKKVNFVLASESALKELVQKYRQYVSQRIQRLLRKDKPAQEQ